MLKSEFHKLFEIKEGFKKEVTEMKKKNVRMQRKTDDLEFTITTMRELLNDDENSEAKDPLAGMNPKLKAKMIADKKRRERELLQKKMAAGVDFLGDGDVNLNDNKKGTSTIQ